MMYDKNIIGINVANIGGMMSSEMYKIDICPLRVNTSYFEIPAKQVCRCNLPGASRR